MSWFVKKRLFQALFGLILGLGLFISYLVLKKEAKEDLTKADSIHSNRTLSSTSEKERPRGSFRMFHVSEFYYDFENLKNESPERQEEIIRDMAERAGLTLTDTSHAFIYELKMFAVKREKPKAQRYISSDSSQIRYEGNFIEGDLGSHLDSEDEGNALFQEHETSTQLTQNLKYLNETELLKFIDEKLVVQKLADMNVRVPFIGAIYELPLFSQSGIGNILAVDATYFLLSAGTFLGGVAISKFKNREQNRRIRAARRQQEAQARQARTVGQTQQRNSQNRRYYQAQKNRFGEGRTPVSSQSIVKKHLVSTAPRKSWVKATTKMIMQGTTSFLGKTFLGRIATFAAKFQVISCTLVYINDVTGHFGGGNDPSRSYFKKNFVGPFMDRPPGPLTQHVREEQMDRIKRAQPDEFVLPREEYDEIVKDLATERFYDGAYDSVTGVACGRNKVAGILTMGGLKEPEEIDKDSSLKPLSSVNVMDQDKMLKLAEEGKVTEEQEEKWGILYKLYHYGKINAREFNEYMDKLVSVDTGLHQLQSKRLSEEEWERLNHIFDLYQSRKIDKKSAKELLHSGFTDNRDFTSWYLFSSLFHSGDISKEELEDLFYLGKFEEGHQTKRINLMHSLSREGKITDDVLQELLGVKTQNSKSQQKRLVLYSLYEYGKIDASEFQQYEDKLAGKDTGLHQLFESKKLPKQEWERLNLIYKLFNSQKIDQSVAKALLHSGQTTQEDFIRWYTLFNLHDQGKITQAGLKTLFYSGKLDKEHQEKRQNYLQRILQTGRVSKDELRWVSSPRSHGPNMSQFNTLLRLQNQGVITQEQTKELFYAGDEEKRYNMLYHLYISGQITEEEFGYLIAGHEPRKEPSLHGPSGRPESEESQKPRCRGPNCNVD